MKEEGEGVGVGVGVAAIGVLGVGLLDGGICERVLVATTWQSGSSRVTLVDPVG